METATRSYIHSSRTKLNRNKRTTEKYNGGSHLPLPSPWLCLGISPPAALVGVAVVAVAVAAVEAAVAMVSSLLLLVTASLASQHLFPFFTCTAVVEAAQVVAMVAEVEASFLLLLVAASQYLIASFYIYSSGGRGSGGRGSSGGFLSPLPLCSLSGLPAAFCFFLHGWQW